jgi:hypothetical protein
MFRRGRGNRAARRQKRSRSAGFFAAGPSGS